MWWCIIAVNIDAATAWNYEQDQSFVTTATTTTTTTTTITHSNWNNNENSNKNNSQKKKKKKEKEKEKRSSIWWEYYGRARGVVVIVKVNGFGNLSSNPRRGFLVFHFTLTPIKRHESILSYQFWVNSRLVCAL